MLQGHSNEWIWILIDIPYHVNTKQMLVLFKAYILG